MSLLQRPKSLAEVAQRILEGAGPGAEVKDFLHEFHFAGKGEMLAEAPAQLEGLVPDGRRLDAYLQALAVYLALKLGQNPPSWTQPAVALAKPWFASPGTALRNYLLLSSPASFRARNLFIDEDSLVVA